MPLAVEEVKRAEHRDYMARRRAEAKRSGLCGRCLTRPIAPGKSKCGKCLGAGAKQMAGLRSRRRKTGLCHECDQPAIIGRVHCHRHRAAALERDADYRERVSRGIRLFAHLPREFWLITDDDLIIEGPFDYRAEAGAARAFHRNIPVSFVVAT